MRREKQRKIVNVERGLFLIRYASAEDEARPPKVTVQSGQESERFLTIVTHPDEDRAELWRPGACLVMQSSAQGRLIIEVEPWPDSVSASATVRVEALTQGRLAAASPSAENWSREPISFDLAGFALTGHLAGVGDVRVKAGEWLAGPAAPSRIEGISIEWDNKPEDIDLRYSVTTARAQTISQRAVELGAFAGTRGKSMALVALALELNGPAAGLAQLSAQAIFLGSPAIRRIGRRILLAGPTGREPLVGLRLAVERADEAIRTDESLEGGGRDLSAGRVQVFRSPTREQGAASRSR